MLKEIRFKNWKSFKDATLFIDSLTVLIGTNASGKSNVIDALEFLSKAAKGIEFETIFREIRGGVEWAALKPGNEFSIEVLMEVDEYLEFELNITIETSPIVQLISESLKMIERESGSTSEKLLYRTKKAKENESLIQVEFLESSFEGQFEYSRDMLILYRLRNYVTHNPSKVERKLLYSNRMANVGIAIVTGNLANIFILDPIPSLMRDYVPVSKNLLKDCSNLAGVLLSRHPVEKQKIEKQLTDYISSLPENEIRGVWAEPIGRLKKDAMLYCEEEWIQGQQPVLVDASGMSDGTLRFLGIITALLTLPPRSQLVIEEVDNGLHPSRSNMLLKTLREIASKRNIDVLVTTHNPALLDALGPEMVPFIMVAHRSQETGESKLTLLEDIHNLPKLLASGPLGKIVTQGAVEKSLHEGEGEPS